MIDDKEWHRIGDTLTEYLGICGCQRKIKSIVDNLWEMKRKNQDAYENGTKREFTGSEWTLFAMMENRGGKLKGAVMHGVNCEYPIIIVEHSFWKWIDEIKNNPNLEDN